MHECRGRRDARERPLFALCQAGRLNAAPSRDGVMPPEGRSPKRPGGSLSKSLSFATFVPPCTSQGGAEAAVLKKAMDGLFQHPVDSICAPSGSRGRAHTIRVHGGNKCCCAHRSPRHCARLRRRKSKMVKDEVARNHRTACGNNGNLESTSSFRQPHQLATAVRHRVRRSCRRGHCEQLRYAVRH